MSSSHPSPRDSGLRIRVAPPEATFVDWPLVQRPWASLIALGLAAAATLLVSLAAGHWGVGALVATALAITLWKTWLPIHYQMNGAGITARVFGWRRSIPWTAIRHYRVLPGGVLLLPDSEATPLSPLRGLYLHAGDRQQEVLANIEYYLHGWTLSR